MGLDKEAVFHCSPDYKAIQRKGVNYFWNRRTDGFIETDKVGKYILRFLPGNLVEIQTRFRDRGINLSKVLLAGYLNVLLKGGVIADPKNARLPKRKKRRLSADDCPRVSAVIVTFNSMRYIPANLDSLFGQTVPLHQVIVSDNGSTDGTLEWMETHYPQVTVLRNHRNLHYTGAVNAGVRAADGQLLLILNDDVVMQEDFLENLLRRYQESTGKKKLAGVIPQIRLYRTPGFINSVGNVVRNHGWGMDNYFGVVDLGQFSRLKTTSSACFAAVLVTRGAWESVGPMDENFKFYDDVDWSFRAHMHGFDWLVAPEALVYHQFGGTYPSGRKITLVVKSRQRFVLKHLPGRIMLSFFRNYLKEDLRNMARFVKQRKLTFLRYVCAYARLAMELPGLLIHRLRHPRASREDVFAFDRKNPPVVVMANARNQPVVNVGVIRSYYYFL